jgi:hypothetical protein
MRYILEQSNPSLILVDVEYAHLVQGTNVEVIVSHDTGSEGCPYEAFLAEGRQFSQEKGWQGLTAVADEMSPAFINFT